MQIILPDTVAALCPTKDDRATGGGRGQMLSRLAVPLPGPVLERGRLGRSLPGELPLVLHPPPGCVFVSRFPLVQDDCRHTRPDLRRPGARQMACHVVER